jgi:hypothetical protein
VVIYDLNIGRTGGGPDETEAVLVVDPDTVLAEPIAFQRFQAIPWRDPQIDERLIATSPVRAI